MHCSLDLGGVTGLTPTKSSLPRKHGNVRCSIFNKKLMTPTHIEGVPLFLTSSHTPLLSPKSFPGAGGARTEQEVQHCEEDFPLWVWAPSAMLPLRFFSFFHALVLGLANNLALKIWFQDPPFLQSEICKIKL